MHQQKDSKRSIVNRENEKLDSEEIIQKVMNMWKELDEKERQEYYEKNNEQKRKTGEECKEMTKKGNNQNIELDIKTKQTKKSITLHPESIV